MYRVGDWDSVSRTELNFDEIELDTKTRIEPLPTSLIIETISVVQAGMQ